MAHLPETIKIENYLNKAEILQEALAQLQKDFGIYDSPIAEEIKVHLSFESLVNQIMPWVENLIHSRTEAFFATLYRIDIKESVATELASNKDFVGLSTVILRREIEKVLLRKWYAKKL